jgi:hypothetical protein
MVALIEDKIGQIHEVWACDIRFMYPMFDEILNKKRGKLSING